MVLPVCGAKMSGRKQLQDGMNKISSGREQILKDSFKQMQIPVL